MNYDKLWKDFSKRRPIGPPISRTAWFTAQWGDPNDSRNDVLRRYLKQHNIPYLSTINGDVWFLYQGDWRMCEFEGDLQSFQVYLLEFDNKQGKQKEELYDCC